MTKRELIDFKKFIRKDLYDKGLKQCGQCHQIKTLDDFHNNATKWGNKHTVCKTCHIPIAKKAHRKACKNVTDWYVRLYAFNSYDIAFRDFPPEALELMRQQILTNRKLKQIKHEKTVK